MFTRYAKMTELLIDIVKKMEYKLYKSIYKTSRKANDTPHMIRGILNEKFKGLSDQPISERDLWAETTMADEYRWHASPQKNLLYISSPAVIETLSSLKITFGDKTADLFPFESLDVAIPKGTKILGREIDGLLINKFNSFHESNDTMLKFLKDCGSDASAFLLINDSMDSTFLSICFSFADEEFCTYRVIAPSEILNAAAEMSKEDFKELMTKKNSTLLNSELKQNLFDNVSAEDVAREQLIIRLVTSIAALYNTETGKGAFTKSFPDGVDKKTKTKLKECTVSTLEFK